MTPDALAELVRGSALTILGERGLDTAAVAGAVSVARPRDPGRGDYATAAALVVGRRVGMEPRELAGELAEALTGAPGVESAEVAGPGFVNVRMTAQARADVVRAAMRSTSTMEAEPTDVAAALVRFTAARGSTVDGVAALRRTDDNPAFRVLFAHARLCSLLRNASDLGITRREIDDADLAQLVHPREVDLVVAIAHAMAADPAHLARHLEQVADAVDGFHPTCRVLPQGDDEPGPTTHARLALCVAARQVLAAGLAALGVTAPERM